MDLSERCRRCVQAGRAGDALGMQEAAGCLMALLADFRRQVRSGGGTDRDSRVAAVLEQLTEQPARRWSLTDMAKSCHLSVAQFNRRFVALAGDSPGRYAVRCRIERAKLLLRDSPLGVGEIAEALGYRDIYYFSHQFRQVAGLSPRRWRQKRSEESG